MKNPHTVIIRPHLTEQTYRLSYGQLSAKNVSDENAVRHYTFIVDKSANKIEIKKAFDAIYNADKTGDKAVSVEKIQTAIVRGKARRVGSKNKGKTSSYKKAVVTLAKGQTLEEYGV